MPENLDREIRSLVVELIESSPAPRPASTLLLETSRPQTPVTLRAGLARMVLVAVLVLAAGVAGAFIGRILLPSANLATTPRVVEGTLSVEPGFSTAELGTEVRLLSTGGELQPDVESENLDGDVIAVGRIEATDVEVFTWRMLNPQARCVEMVSSSGHETTCSFPYAPSGGTVQAPWGVGRMVPDGGGPVDVVAIWRVPEGTSIVTVEGADGIRVWQRPVAGIAAFTFDPDLALVTMEALSSDGLSLGRTGISPDQILTPEEVPEVSLEGAEDTAELSASHPANLLLAAGLTGHDAFADAARAEGLNFVCAAGGGLAEWELCLVAAKGTLAVVPFESEQGLVARISHPGLSGDVVVPLDTGRPVGVRYTGPQATVDIEYLGERFGKMTAPSP